MNNFFNKLNTFFKEIGIEEIKFKETKEKIIYEYNTNDFSHDKLYSYNLESLYEELGDALSILVHEDESRWCYCKESIEYLQDFLKDRMYVCGKYNVEIYINKNRLIDKFINHDHVVFFMEVNNFYNWIKKKDILELEKDVFVFSINTIIIYNDDIHFDNGYIRILNYSFYKEDINFDKSKILKNIKFRNEHCNWQDSTRWLTPDFIYFDCDDKKYIDLQNYFYECTIKLLIPFIASATYNDGNNIAIVINGHKKIKFFLNRDIKFTSDSVKYLFDTYKWIYDDNYNSDKMYILRNLITVYLCDECSKDYLSMIIDHARDIYDTTIKNFDIYLKENVEKYFVERNNLKKLIHDTSNQISDEISSITNNITKSFLSAIGIVLISFITYINKGSKNIFLGAIVLYIVFIVANLIFSIIYYPHKIKIIKTYYSQQDEALKKYIVKKRHSI